jgi:hypothetical protein
MTPILQGGCVCGKVRFTANRPPLRTFACHCTFCQKLTGSSFYASSVYELDAVDFNEGELKQFAHTSDESGKKVYVHFCASCGTTVGLTFERWPAMRSISRGCYDDANAVEITSHIWTRSAQAGVVLPAGVDCFEKARATLDGEALPSVKHAQPVLSRASMALHPETPS